MKKMALFIFCLVITLSTSYNLFSQNLTEGFEGATVPPERWIVNYANPNPPAGNLVSHSTTYAHQGTRSFRFSSFSAGAPYDQYLITPRLETTLENRTISFYYRRHTWGNETFRVGWSTTGTNLEDFQWSNNITNASEVWQQYVKNDLPIGNSVYVCIHYFSNYEYYLYIDTVVGPAIYIPEVPPAHAINVSPEHRALEVLINASLNWRAGDDFTDSYDVYFGTELPDEPNSANQEETTFNPGLLDYNTTYFWKIIPRNQWGAAQNPPLWQFTTHGDPTVTRYPYNQSFEREDFPPLGWTQELHHGETQWIRGTGGYTNNTNPVGAAHGDFNARFYGGANRRHSTSLISPPFDVSEIGTPQLIFWHAQAVWAGDQDSLKVYYRTSHDGEWQLLARYRENIPTWTERSFYLPEQAELLYFRFEALSDFGYGVVLDNITVQEAPAVIAPTLLTVANISGTSADLGWQENGNAAIWDIELGVFGFEPTGIPTAAGVRDNPYRYENLQPSTRYQFYVRADGGEDGYSAWAGPQSFYTSQIPATLPYNEGFEEDILWTIVNGEQVNKWALGTATAQTGQRSAYISNDGGTTNFYNITATSKVHIFRDIQFPEEAAGNFELYFWWKGMGEGINFQFDYLTAHLVDPNIMPVAGQAVTVGQLGNNLNLQENWEREMFIIPFAQNEGQVKRLIFTWHNDASLGTQPPIAIDNILVREPPEEPPTHAELVAPPDRGENVPLDVILRWQPGDHITRRYDVYLGNPLPDEPVSANQEETFYNTGLLLPETTYSWKIVPRNQFGAAEDCPVWSFTTGEDVTVTRFPWNESFEREEFPPYGWEHVSVVGATEWIRATGGSTNNTNPVGAADGDFNARFYAGANRGHTAYLKTPPLDFRLITNPHLSFWYAQAVWAGDQDSLKVFYRDIDDEEWQLLASYTNNIPEWTQRNFDLPGDLGITFIKFEAYGDFGYGVVLDNIIVTGEGLIAPIVKIEIDDNRVRLSWEALPHATSYRIIYSYEPYAPINEWIEADVVEETEYIENIDESGKKFFRVIGLGEDRQRIGRQTEIRNKR